MEFSEESINEFLENNVFIYLVLFLVMFIVGYFLYNHFSSENLFENTEQQLNNMKENIAFYTNKLLLFFNMEGNSIKSTQFTSF
jgi:flagellar basal body-associated protein FliL